MSLLSKDTDADFATLNFSPVQTSNVGNKEGEGGDLMYHLSGRIQIILLSLRLGSDDGQISNVDADDKYEDNNEEERRGGREE